jgi:hypothetical protein
MKPALPGLPTVSALMLSALLAVWLGVSGPINHDFLYRWQPLIGGLITFFGILIASYNVTRQMQLTARLKEEEILEGALPGLNSAFVFFGRFIWMLASGVPNPMLLRVLDKAGQTTDTGPQVLEEIAKLIPEAKDPLRREVADVILSLRKSMRFVEDTKVFFRESKENIKHVEETDPSQSEAARDLLTMAHTTATVALREYGEARDQAIEFNNSLGQRILSHRARLLELRKDKAKLLKLRS